MKKTSLINKTKMACLAVAIIGLTAVSARADYVLGSWQNNVTDGGWCDWGSGFGLDAGGTAQYSIVSGAVPGFANSLSVQQSGWAFSLTLKMENNPGDVAAFLTNSILSFQMSGPAWTDGTGGYDQVYNMVLNSSAGWNGIAWSGGTGWSWSTTDVIGSNNNSGNEPNYYYPNDSLRSEIVSFNYAGLIPSLEAAGVSPTSGYLELIFGVNPGGGTSYGGPPNLLINNVVLTVPEPATLAMLGLGLTAGIAFLRRRSA